MRRFNISVDQHLCAEQNIKYTDKEQTGKLQVIIYVKYLPIVAYSFHYIVQLRVIFTSVLQRCDLNKQIWNVNR